MKPEFFKLIVFGILFFSFVSCEKEITTSETTIYVKLTDDVCPLRGLFTIDHQVSGTEWQINDTLIYGTVGYPEGEFVLDHIFDEPGNYEIELFARTYDYYSKVTGRTELEIPEIANKLDIYGIDMNNKIFTSENTTLKLNFKYTYESAIHYSIEKTEEYSPNMDSIEFTEPITLDLPDMISTDPNSFRLSILISDLTTNKKYYEGFIALNHAYFSERLFSNPLKGEIIESEGGRIFYFNLDWYCE